MRKRIGIFGLSEEALQLIPLLVANPEVELGGIVDRGAPDDRSAFDERLRRRDGDLGATIAAARVASVANLLADVTLHAVIDASPEEEFAGLCPDAVERNLQIVSPLTARLLWGYGAPSVDRKAELLQTLAEVVESYNLTIDTDELFGRMLEIARSVTGADGGSLMLLDSDRNELLIRVAAGIEPELWTKIRVPIGDGIAGRVAADARPLRLRGKADREAFHILHERLDVVSALCVPLVHDGRVLGVLNLHHASRPDAFSDEDLEFAEQLARLDAQIIARSQEHEALRSQAARYEAVRAVQAIVAGRAPLPDRLAELCEFAAGSLGGGVANLFLLERGGHELRLSATSLEGGGFGGEYRVTLGQGIDGTAAKTREAAILRGSDGAIAYAALPLLAGDSLVGVLALQSGASVPRGRGVEVLLLEIAAAAAEGIARVMREAQMTARATKLGAINETGIRMVSTTDPAEVLRLGASGAAMVLEADHAVLRLQDEETGRYVIRSYFGSADGRLQERLFRFDKQVSVDAIKRRAAVLVRDARDQPALDPADSGVKSLLAAPLKRDGRVIGTLTLYDKVAPDRFATGYFEKDDLELFTKFVSYLERAIANALLHAHTRQFRNFDEETGVPNAGYLAKRIDEEIARGNNRDGALAIAICTLENLADVEAAGDSAKARRVVQCTVDALRANARDFDVIGRTGAAELAILLPDPGRDASTRIYDLARAVADDVAHNDPLNDPERVALAFGYAVYPTDGNDQDALLKRAREPRIRMV